MRITAMWNTCAGRALVVILACVILDILAYAGVDHDGVPLSSPVSLAVGKFRSPGFTTLMGGNYHVNIVSPSDRVATDVVRANCILRSSGVIFARGSSDDTRGRGFRALDETLQQIGTFACDGPNSYDLEVDFMNDNSGLAFANPRLEVAESDFSGAIFVEWCLVVLLVVHVVVGLGIIIFVIAKAIL